MCSQVSEHCKLKGKQTQRNYRGQEF